MNEHARYSNSMKTTKILLFILFLGLTSLLFSRIVKAAETGTVTATVTVQNISVTVTTDGAVAFGTINVGTTKPTTSVGINDTEAVQNNGNITEDFNIKAVNSTSSGAGWTFGSAAASETYTMKFCITNCDASPTWSAIGISPSYTTLKTGVAASASQDFDLLLYTPTSTTDYNEQSMVVTIQAIAG